MSRDPGKSMLRSPFALLRSKAQADSGSPSAEPDTGDRPAGAAPMFPFRDVQAELETLREVNRQLEWALCLLILQYSPSGLASIPRDTLTAAPMYHLETSVDFAKGDVLLAVR